jgi:hypothetical protein
MNHPTCRLCGGDARKLPPEGAHYLCLERARLGLATPSLGRFCPDCHGNGHLGTVAAGPMLSLSLGPSAIARSIQAVFPPCRACHGSGFVKGAL